MSFNQEETSDDNFCECKSFNKNKKHNKDNMMRCESGINNIKSIYRMNIYLQRAFYSYWSLYKIFNSIQDEILKIQNELNFRKVDKQLIESYNKMLENMYNDVSGILSQTISGSQYSETPIILPVSDNNFSHKLEIVYFLPSLTSITKPIGSLTNISSIKINDHIRILRGYDTYEFVLIDCDDVLSIEHFRMHLQKYLESTKKLAGFLYNDIEYVKLSFKALFDIMTDTIKLAENKYIRKKWLCLLKKIQLSVDSMCKFMKESNNCE